MASFWCYLDTVGFWDWGLELPEHLGFNLNFHSLWSNCFLGSWVSAKDLSFSSGLGLVRLLNVSEQHGPAISSQLTVGVQERLSIMWSELHNFFYNCISYENDRPRDSIQKSKIIQNSIQLKKKKKKWFCFKTFYVLFSNFEFACFYILRISIVDTISSASVVYFQNHFLVRF